MCSYGNSYIFFINSTSKSNFLQSNLLSKRLFAYSLLNNFSNVIIGVLLILIGYQIKGNIKLIKKYVYIYVVNLLIFIGLFLWTRSFTIQNLYDAVLPITRNTYPIVLGAISALLIKDKLKNWFKKYRFPVILSGYAIVLHYQVYLIKIFLG